MKRCLTWLGFLLAVGLNLTAQANPKRQLHDLKQRIQQVQKDVSQTEGTRQQALEQLKNVEKSIVVTTHKLKRLEQQQTKWQRELGGLYQQTDEVQGTLGQEQGALSASLTQRYRDSFDGEWTESSPEQTLARQVYVEQLARDQQHQILGAQETIQSLSEMTRTHEKKVQELKRVQTEMVHQQARLKEENETKARWVAALSQRLESQKHSLSSLQRDAARLSQLMETLARQAEARRQRRHREHREAPATPTDNTVATIRETPEAGMDDSRFSRLRGSLRLPVAGELKNRFGSPRVDTGLKWSGLFIQCPSGRPVKAVASGRVVYADWLRGFGQVLIIDHGAGYMSLYGGGERLTAHVGESVAKGALVAETGNSGNNDETGLYFELRYQGKPFDPMSWVGHP